MDCNKEVETLKRIQAETQMEWKHPIIQLGISMGNLTHRISQAEGSILNVKDKQRLSRVNMQGTWKN